MKRLLVGFLLVLLSVTTGRGAAPPAQLGDEPTYRGRPLSRWVDRVLDDPHVREEALAALAARAASLKSRPQRATMAALCTDGVFSLASCAKIFHAVCPPRAARASMAARRAGVFSF